MYLYFTGSQRVLLWPVFAIVVGTIKCIHVCILILLYLILVTVALNVTATKVE